jgi:hypothetical protein
MTAVMPEIEAADLTLEDHEFDLDCDYNDGDRPGWPVRNHGPVRWIVGVGAECGHHKTRLLCTQCKDVLMFMEESGMICRHCDHVVIPPRNTIRFIEPFRK